MSTTINTAPAQTARWNWIFTLWGILKSLWAGLVWLWLYLVRFRWATDLLDWALESAGTVSEFAFVVAILWMCTNASVHNFYLMFFTEAQTKGASYFADMALAGLPELLGAAAIVKVVKQLWLIVYEGKKPWQNVNTIWLVAYGFPTIVFVSMTMFSAINGLEHTDTGVFNLPVWAIVVRGVAAYWYGLSSILYKKLGKPQEVKRLEEKDAIIAQLRQDMTDKLAELNQQNANNLSSLVQNKDAIIAQLRQDNQTLTVELDSHKRELEQVKELLAEYKAEKQQLINAVNQGSEAALQAYGEDVINWLKSGVKTVSRDDITRYTGHPKKKIEEAIAKGSLQKSTRNEQLILVNTLIDWLKITPAPKVKTEPKTEPSLHIVHA